MPIEKLAAIYELIKYITADIADQLEKESTQSYLITSDVFESIFNRKEKLKDAGVFE